MKIIGYTVGTPLPKPNFDQTDPTKGDYIRNKPDFDGLKSEVNAISALVGDASVSEQINTTITNKTDTTLTVECGLADAKAVGDAIASINVMTASDDGTGIVTLFSAPSSEVVLATLPDAEEASF